MKRSPPGCLLACLLAATALWVLFLQTSRFVVTTSDSSASKTEAEPSVGIVFIKTHKTGSSTLTNILIRFGVARNLTFMLRGDCGSKLGLGGTDVYEPPNLSSSPSDTVRSRWTSTTGRYGVVATAKESTVERRRSCRRDILAFHSIYGAWMTQVFPVGSHFITLLRNPVTRTASEFDYENMSKQLQRQFKLPYRPTLVDMCNNAALKQFTARKLQTMSKQLGSASSAPWKQFPADNINVELEQQKALLRNRFSLVGITEEFDKTLIAFKHIFGLEYADISYKPMKVRHSSYNLSKETEQCLKEISGHDVELYEYGRALFRDKLVALGLTKHRIDKEVQKLHRMNRHFMRQCSGNSGRVQPTNLSTPLTLWCKKKFEQDRFSQVKVSNCLYSVGTMNWTDASYANLAPASSAWCNLFEYDIREAFPLLLWKQEALD